MKEKKKIKLLAILSRKRKFKRTRINMDENSEAIQETKREKNEQRKI